MNLQIQANLQAGTAKRCHNHIKHRNGSSRTACMSATQQLHNTPLEQLVPQHAICSALARRQVLLSSSIMLLQSSCLIQQQQALAEDSFAAQQQQVLRVGRGQQYQSISAAVDAALPGSLLLIDAGRYNERLVISKSIKLAAAQQVGSVEVVWDTQQPYQHCLEIPASSSQAAAVVVEVQGLTFHHYSKSVANNYCIFAQSGQLLLQSCDVSSRSGVGVGVEGAELQLSSCTVHDCERHGVAVFGALEGGLGRCQLMGCSITSNKLNGVLVRDGAELNMSGCTVQGNAGYGLQLQDCSAVISGSSLLGNRGGAAALQLGSVALDRQQLEQLNNLDGPLQLL